MDSKKEKKEAGRQAHEDFRGAEQTCHLHLDDVKETIVTENTYKAIPYNVLKTYFLPKGMF